MNTFWRRNAAAICINAAALPPIALVAAVVMYGCDLPIMDEWDFFLPLLRKSHEGGLELGDFFVQHNEHWLAVPLFFMLPLARLSNWDLRLELAGTVIFALILFAALARHLVLAYREHAYNPWNWTLPLWSLMFFSVSQWQTWMWPMHILLTFAICCAIASLIVLASGMGRISIVASIVLALAATFSHGVCVAVWPAGLAVLVFRHNGARNSIPVVAVWVVATIAAAIVFIAPLRATAAAGRIPSAAMHPGLIVEYVLAFIGAPIFQAKLGSARIAGALGLLGTLWLCARLWRVGAFHGKRLALLPGLATFSLAAAVIVAAGRYYDAPDQALSSRYITFSTPLWLAFTGLFYAAATGAGDERMPIIAGRSPLIIPTAIFLLVVAGSARGAYWSDERYDGFEAARAAFIAGEESNLLLRLHPDLETVISGRKFMQRHKLGVFR
jgi:hypothetical protein